MVGNLIPSVCDKSRPADRETIDSRRCARFKRILSVCGEGDVTTTNCLKRPRHIEFDIEYVERDESSVCVPTATAHAYIRKSTTKIEGCMLRMVPSHLQAANDKKVSTREEK